MPLEIWLPALLAVGVGVLGLLAAFVYFCDRV